MENLMLVFGELDFHSWVISFGEKTLLCNYILLLWELVEKKS